MARYSTVRLALSFNFHLHDFLAPSALDLHFALSTGDKQQPITERAPDFSHISAPPYIKSLSMSS
jgi:hypothetical protein